MITTSIVKRFVPVLILVAICVGPGMALADSLNNDASNKLRQLTAQNPAAAHVNRHAIAVLVFPRVVKAGFIVGAQTGMGILFVHRQEDRRYRTVAASYGLQAGVQEFGYAIFFMNQRALNWIHQTQGWEIGTGPSVVVVDKGMARTLSSTTLHGGIYAFTFDQRGLMAGLGLQGTKIIPLGK